jgi:hypothetical protein
MREIVAKRGGRARGNTEDQKAKIKEKKHKQRIKNGRGVVMIGR